MKIYRVRKNSLFDVLTVQPSNIFEKIALILKGYRKVQIHENSFMHSANIWMHKKSKFKSDYISMEGEE